MLTITSCNFLQTTQVFFVFIKNPFPVLWQQIERNTKIIFLIYRFIDNKFRKFRVIDNRHFSFIVIFYIIKTKCVVDNVLTTKKNRFIDNTISGKKIITENKVNINDKKTFVSKIRDIDVLINKVCVIDNKHFQ